MTKATVTGRQRGAAVLAGTVGHLLFAIGWLGLGFLAVGSGLAALLGGTIGLTNVGGVEGISEVLTQAGSIMRVLGIVFGIIALVLILLGFFLSGWILKVGAVRKPWVTTLTSLGIVAILDLPLSVLYLWIAAQLTDTRVAGPFFLGPFIFVIGTIVVGVLVWLWMTWAHRGRVAA